MYVVIWADTLLRREAYQTPSTVADRARSEGQGRVRSDLPRPKRGAAEATQPECDRRIRHRSTRSDIF